MSTILTIVKTLIGLGPALTKAFLALFLINSGVNKEVLKGARKDLKDAKKAGKRKNHISTLSDDDLNSGL